MSTTAEAENDAELRLSKEQTSSASSIREDRSSTFSPAEPDNLKIENSKGTLLILLYFSFFVSIGATFSVYSATAMITESLEYTNIISIQIVVQFLQLLITSIMIVILIVILALEKRKFDYPLHEHRNLFQRFHTFFGFTFSYKARREQQANHVDQIGDIIHEGEGFNIYVRVGLTIFALAFFANQLSSFIYPNAKDSRGKCYLVHGVLFYLLNSSEVLYVFLHTFFILLYHRIVFLRRFIFVRVLLIHLLMVDLSLWMDYTAFEVYVSAKNMNGEETGVNGETNVTKNSTVNETLKCKEVYNLQILHKILVPAIIEYTLLSIPMLLQMMAVFGQPKLNKMKEYRPTHIQQEVRWIKRESVSAVFIILSAVASVSTVAAENVIVTVVKLLVIVLAAIVISTMALINISDLGYSQPQEPPFEEQLLIISFMGTCLFSCLSIQLLFQNTMRTVKEALHKNLYVGWQVLNFLQATIQFLQIMDSLRRRKRLGQTRNGSYQILSLLGLNLALWLAVTFEVKEHHTSIVLYQRWHNDIWSVLIHCTYPFHILFRFHSTSCLSVIWSKAFNSEMEYFRATHAS